MRNKNDFRNKSYQRDWDQYDQGYDRNRENQNRYRNFDSDRGSQQWQSTAGRGDTGNYDPYRNRENDDYLYGQNREDYERSYDQNRRRNYGRNDWNEEKNYGSDYRNNPNTGERDWWDKTTDEVSSWFGDDDAERRRRMDKINGPHRGKGPKGYLRSDDRITEDINEKLYEDSYVDASNLEIKVTDGEVTLSGTVDSRDIKRRAEDLAESVTGVKNVQNQIRVDSSKTGSSSFDKSGQEVNQNNGRRKTSNA